MQEKLKHTAQCPIDERQRENLDLEKETGFFRMVFFENAGIVIEGCFSTAHLAFGIARTMQQSPQLGNAILKGVQIYHQIQEAYPEDEKAQQLALGRFIEYGELPPCQCEKCKAKRIMEAQN